MAGAICSNPKIPVFAKSTETDVTEDFTDSIDYAFNKYYGWHWTDVAIDRLKNYAVKANNASVQRLIRKKRYS